ncbi:uncharacterized protein LOC125204855 [Salvia hispanica]|uniref:uncharacterized protein LOC125187748 n=1 Tax=Salvia hispanica TaxID=49212 RepID=UPI00200950F0|nr:uncharacterized protein LOC125187748 [Salvia hispanica]XP_047959562.1 uncharacterized protein LOC125204855 [Salvia hispanica]
MDCSRDERRWCCYHPTEMVVGVCALCLNEKLLVVAKKRQRITHYSFLPKIFALTNPRRSHTPSSPSPEDSFISIKFEENGVASWDKGKTSKIAHDEKYCDEKFKSVVEHTKPRMSLRWRRRIGHLFHLIKRKRPAKAKSAPSTLKGRMLNIGG